MNFFEMNVAAMLVGFVLDLMIGDPDGWTHPVIWIGKWISFAEKKLRNRGSHLRRSALVLTASTVIITMLCTGIALGILALIHKAALFMGMCVSSWWCLSAKCLAVEAKGVYRALGISIEKGRAQVARIVGWDTAELSEEEIIYATVETVAENTTDGVISPMLYLVIGAVLTMGFNGRADYQAWIDSNGELPFPGGESRAEFAARCAKAFDELGKRNLQDDCAIIAHGGTIMAVMEQNAKPKGHYYDFQIKNGCGYILYDNGSFTALS